MHKLHLCMSAFSKAGPQVCFIAFFFFCRLEFYFYKQLEGGKCFIGQNEKLWFYHQRLYSESHHNFSKMLLSLSCFQSLKKEHSNFTHRGLKKDVIELHFVKCRGKCFWSLSLTESYMSGPRFLIG